MDEDGEDIYVVSGLLQRWHYRGAWMIFCYMISFITETARVFSKNGRYCPINVQIVIKILTVEMDRVIINMTFSKTNRKT